MNYEVPNAHEACEQDESVQDLVAPYLVPSDLRLSTQAQDLVRGYIALNCEPPKRTTWSLQGWRGDVLDIACDDLPSTWGWADWTCGVWRRQPPDLEALTEELLTLIKRLRLRYSQVPALPPRAERKAKGVVKSYRELVRPLMVAGKWIYMLSVAIDGAAGFLAAQRHERIEPHQLARVALLGTPERRHFDRVASWVSRQKPKAKKKARERAAEPARRAKQAAAIKALRAEPGYRARANQRARERYAARKAAGNEV